MSICNSWEQKPNLDELLRLNTKDFTDLRRTLTSKGYELTNSGPGAYDVRSYKWVSNDETTQLFFRDEGNSTSLHLGPITFTEYNVIKKQLVTRGFKRLPYKNYNPDNFEFVNYKRGKIGVTFFITSRNEKNARYEVAVSD
ncbi:MAG: hypothetical protein WKF35_13310 [Ferruginibacter sp.]